MDPGFSHATGAVFGFPDFSRGKFVIEGDFAVQRQNSRQVSRLLKAREWQLWGRAPIQPANMTDQAWKDELDLIRAEFYPGLESVAKPVCSWGSGQPSFKTTMRVSDTNAQLIADMSSEHGLIFSPAEKDDSEAALNAYRIALAGLKYEVHERCVDTIAHLEQAIWNKGRTNMAESSGGGHFDTIPAGVYLNRKSGQFKRNPNPQTAANKHTHHVPAPARAGSKTHQALLRLFKR